MYKELPYEEEFLNTTAEEFASLIYEAIKKVDGVEWSEVELYVDTDNPTHYKVAYFNIDDRRFTSIKFKEIETLLNGLALKYSMADLNWDKVDAYPDGTSSYALYFTIK